MYLTVYRLSKRPLSVEDAKAQFRRACQLVENSSEWVIVHRRADEFVYELALAHTVSASSLVTRPRQVAVTRARIRVRTREPQGRLALALQINAGAVWVAVGLCALGVFALVMFLIHDLGTQGAFAKPRVWLVMIWLLAVEAAFAGAVVYMVRLVTREARKLRAPFLAV